MQILLPELLYPINLMSRSYPDQVSIAKHGDLALIVYVEIVYAIFSTINSCYMINLNILITIIF